MLLAKRLIFLILIAAFIAGPLSATATAASDGFNADRPDGASMAADFFFVRPVALVSTVFGSATFVVSLPFSALGKNVGESYDLLVIAPARYTFDRPLGKFD